MVGSQHAQAKLQASTPEWRPADARKRDRQRIRPATASSGGQMSDISDETVAYQCSQLGGQYFLAPAKVMV